MGSSSADHVPLRRSPQESLLSPRPQRGRLVAAGGSIFRTARSRRSTRIASSSCTGPRISARRTAATINMTRRLGVTTGLVRARASLNALVLFLITPILTLTSLANASPPDPTWLPGYFDDDDFDDVVGYITSATGVAAGPLVRCARPVSVLVVLRCERQKIRARSFRFRRPIPAVLPPSTRTSSLPTSWSTQRPATSGSEASASLRAFPASPSRPNLPSSSPEHFPTWRRNKPGE
jgi:hypothetical protein